MLPTQGDSNVTCIIKGPRKCHIDSFDTWLHAWNVYEKLVMAAQPARYTELASYREQIQFANRKFRWSSVYLLDIHLRMAHASKCLHDSSLRLDIIDTTLYATILDASALRPHPRQCSRCKSFDHMVKDCAFPASVQMEETLTPTPKTLGNSPRNTFRAQTSSTQYISNQSSWKYAKWFSPSGQEGCNLSQRKACYQGPNCKRAHICKTCKGTTLRPIAQSLPQIKSPFPIDIWRDTLHNHPDSELMNDLLHDIEYGVCIGFHHDRTPLISSNHFSAISNPAPVAKELERELH